MPNAPIPQKCQSPSRKIWSSRIFRSRAVIWGSQMSSACGWGGRSWSCWELPLLRMSQRPVLPSIRISTTRISLLRSKIQDGRDPRTRDLVQEPGHCYQIAKNRAQRRKSQRYTLSFLFRKMSQCQTSKNRYTWKKAKDSIVRCGRIGRMYIVLE